MASDLLLLGPSEAAGRLAEHLARVASTPRTTVLLRGAPGVELELAAREIHARSRGSAGGPFLSVPGRAVHGVEELFQEARGGTLYLAEVLELSPEAQGSLFQALDERAGRAGIPDEARLVASSSADLEDEVGAGRLREDLFYRLNVLSIRVPALESRLADLEALTERLLERARSAFGRPLRPSPAALARLAQHAWSGGLLELEGVLLVAAVRATWSGDGLELEEAHLPALLPPSTTAEHGTLAPARSLRAVEEATIRRVLAEEDGNRSRAARTLGINRTTLYNKLRQYGIS